METQVVNDIKGTEENDNQLTNSDLSGRTTASDPHAHKARRQLETTSAHNN